MCVWESWIFSEVSLWWESVQRMYICICGPTVISSDPFVVLSSVSPQKYARLSSEPVSKEEEKKNQIKNKENRELGGPPVNPLN